MVRRTEVTLVPRINKVPPELHEQVHSLVVRQAVQLAEVGPVYVCELDEPVALWFELVLESVVAKSRPQ